MPYLPPEIVQKIVAYWVPENFENERPTAPYLVISRLWHAILLPYVYAYPKLDSYNMTGFVTAITASKYLGSFVITLDLSRIIQAGKNSYTSKLLRRCHERLEHFVAPATSFGFQPLLSLRQCTSLTTLDLSLVSETVDLRELFAAIKNLPHLEYLYFPRSSVFCAVYDSVWPVQMRTLGLSGGISNDFLVHTIFPSTIKNLTMTHCPFITAESFQTMCRGIGHNLLSLKVIFPLPGMRPNAMDGVLQLCPNLRTLAVSVDYITSHLFAQSNLPIIHFAAENLVNLDIDSSGMLGQSLKLQPEDITMAILDGKLPKLKNVRISAKLGWNPTASDVSELVDLLDERDGGLWVV
ncbi:hypothetical protein NADFUDRAFT_22970 [Nadsonia fulvescens var. elongata DSM 6958]|uniref:F-box domain-containing protein n=1 Tax=Nadsonia fulvescens var. elongata DSM 6958 TaxID=857566 RepID=A0A1E3PLD3_9ASCO|nr:hypothetical protein NADFUDRAFT_22970 [Nadsonia fulvescens var. elongata DSM 6958]